MCHVTAPATGRQEVARPERARTGPVLARVPASGCGCRCKGHRPDLKCACLQSIPRRQDSVRVHATKSGPSAHDAKAKQGPARPVAQGLVASLPGLPARLWQASLEVGSTRDPHEMEAERLAAQVVEGTAVSSVGSSRVCGCGGRCPRCRGREERPLVQMQQATIDAGSVRDTPPIVGEAAGRDGRSLEPALMREMESRLGHDFSRVRIHTGERADRAARSIGARAYTSGADIVFARGEYEPARQEGRRLLAHELVHVVQQGAAAVLSSGHDRGTLPVRLGRAGASDRIQRATFKVGKLTVNVDYGNVIHVADAALVSTVESQFVAFTGQADASAIHASLAALTTAQQRWVMFALDLHEDNIESPRDDRLDRTVAVQRLIAHAPSATNAFPGGSVGPPEEEALRASGWFEVALSGKLAAPSPAFASGVDVVLNPPAPGGGALPALDVAAFHARMDAAVRHLISFIDPGAWTATGTQSISTLQNLGDEMMEEAKVFFSPYAHTARESVLGIPGFQISPNIFDVTPLTPDRDTRLSYLENRSTIVGRNTSSHARFSDKNIFREVNFDASRPADQLEMEKLTTTLEADATVAAQVDRLIQHTGRQEGTGAATKIGLSTEFDKGTMSECDARWESIETICHEIMHALAHPRVETEAAAVGFGQVLEEGMAEVLATQLFNDRIKPKAKSTPAFKTKLETGIAGAPCPEPADAKIGYGAAGSGADSIRKMVGNKRFRSAFFLGQMHLLGR